MNKITILGIGNILLKDEGFGVRVIEEMQKTYNFSESIQVLDGGTLGMELLKFLTDTDKLIIVDAVSGTQPAGFIYEFSNEEVKAYFTEKVSMHELGIQDVLSALEIISKPIKEVVVIGTQPLIMDVGLELSPVAASAVEPVIERIINKLSYWKIEVNKK
ncbi:HyaD/HybD family hydrogenase maturation endopeptidase [Dendrosporobacter sp. 1207_IL3150]|uniref:HyaD/HybD family hydrogenase maturation endopeptidase n=1 Tax=Dendrosporobacter sp. 1207_IL3150 TaxID=3084054 RepID=UPI002FDA1A77